MILELNDCGFDFSVLCEFRARLIKGSDIVEGSATQSKGEQFLLDQMLEVFREKNLLKARGRQRTDSTHVLAAIRTMNRLELVSETLCAALNELAVRVPEWLRSSAPAEWQQHYGRRAEETRLPRGEQARKEYAQRVGRDGVVLLSLVDEQQPGLNALPAVETLRQVWDRHFVRSEVTGWAWRADADLGRAASAIESPYDTQARHSSKREIIWTGYKAHLTETCDPELPCLITHVHTTVATTQDVSCTADIQQALADRQLLPHRHLVDTGYVDAHLLVSSRQQHGVELFGPPRDGQSWQAREGGYDQSRFSIDWAKQQATCPESKVSTSWGSFRTKPYDRLIVKVRFAERDCVACPSRAKCVRSPSGQSRTLTLPEQTQAQALERTRGLLSSADGRREYGKRAGIEGTLSQAVRRSGLRQARYRGLQKTHFQQVATAAGLNVVRAVNYLSGVPPAQTRLSQFARLYG